MSESSAKVKGIGLYVGEIVHDKHCEVMVDTGAYFCRCWYRARIATLSEALERARGCIKGLCARTPVRDVAETLAEIDSAISAGQGEAK